MNAIEINGLTYTYPGAAHPTLFDISLQIEKGDFLAVVGNNGCGKSTLCKVLNGLIPHFITGEFQGQVRVEMCIRDSSSKRETVPLWGRSSPTINFIRVDLPAPLEPIRATFSPFRMSRFSPSKMERGAPFTER